MSKTATVLAFAQQEEAEQNLIKAREQVRQAQEQTMLSIAKRALNASKPDEIIRYTNGADMPLGTTAVWFPTVYTDSTLYTTPVEDKDAWIFTTTQQGPFKGKGRNYIVSSHTPFVKDTPPLDSQRDDVVVISRGYTFARTTKRKVME